MPIRNKLHNPILKNLFDATSDHKKISEEKLLEIKKDINTLANLDVKDEQGETKLYQEISNVIPEEKIEIPKKILDTQADNNNTLLIFASINGHAELVSQLIDAKASVDMVNDDDDTALFCAIRHNHQAVVSYLLTAKANSERVNVEGQGVLEEAINRSNLSLVSLLLQHHVMIKDYTFLHTFLMSSDPRDPNVVTSFEELVGQFKQFFERLLRIFIRNFYDIPPAVSQAIERMKEVCDTAILLNALDQIETQTKPLSDREKDDAQSMADDAINSEDCFIYYRSAVEYLGKLKKLETLVIPRDDLRKKTLDATLQAIDDEYKENKRTAKMPKDIVNMITSYHYPPLSSLSFFESTDIDNILIKLNEGNQSSLCNFETDSKENQNFTITDRLELIIIRLQQFAKYYLKKPLIINANNRKAAEMLRNLLSDKMLHVSEFELKSLVLESTKEIYNLAQSDILKAGIKEILMQYSHFSKIDFDNYFSQSAEAGHENKMKNGVAF